MSTLCTRWMAVACVFSVACLMFVQTAFADDAYTGEVVAKRVNVRSGPSTNYYVVTRLKAGDRVDVVGEEEGWLAIIPPAGCFSLISKDYVDVGAAGEGVVNGDNVRVHVGSDLNPARYAIHRKLNKGAEVRVTGDTGDGFLKIKPPTGAHVWMHADYVARVPDGRLQQSAPVVAPPSAANTKPVVKATSPASPAKSAPAGVIPAPVAAANEADERVEPVVAAGSGSTDKPEAEAKPAERTPADLGVIVRRPPPVDATRETAAEAGSEVDEPGTMSSNVYRERLEGVDAAMKAEMAKPLEDRYFEEVLAGYRDVATGELDRVTRAFVQRRIEQIEAIAMTTDALRGIRSLSDRVTQDRRDALAERSQLRRPMRRIHRGLDAKGELRESMIYSSPVGPRRYRLIDPNMTVPRTLCYIEVPRDLPIEIEAYLGRLVGVRASAKFLETGDVNPIPIIVAEEFVLLDDPRSVQDEVDPGDGFDATVAPEDDDQPQERASVAAAGPQGS